MQDNLEDLLYSKNVLEFNILVNQYIKILDETVLLSQKDFIDQLHRLLPLIYIKAILLPDTEPIMPDMIEKSVTEEEWDAVEQTLNKKFDLHNNYSENLDALANNSETMISISEGLTDIFQDLKDYIVMFNMGSGEMMNDALWECKNNFKDYWGQRLMNVQRILHHLLYSNDISLSENDALTEDDFDIEKRIKNEQ